MSRDYKIISQEEVFKTPYFAISKEKYVRHDGDEKDYWVLTKQPSVFILAVTDDAKIYFIKQFRYPTRRWSWELPAGSTDGQVVLDAAKRELWEETGLTADRWMYLGEYQVAPGLSTNIGHIYLAKGLTETEDNRQEEEGITECAHLSVQEIRKKIWCGEISDGPTLAVLAKVLWSTDKCIHDL